MNNENIELLRFTTAGSVDDGKSTLIVNPFFKTNLILLKNPVKTKVMIMLIYHYLQMV